MALDGLVKYRNGAGIGGIRTKYPAPALKSATASPGLTQENCRDSRPAENVNSMGSTLGLSAYLLKVFCKGPVQKGHVVKI